MSHMKTADGHSLTRLWLLIEANRELHYQSLRVIAVALGKHGTRSGSARKEG